MKYTLEHLDLAVKNNIFTEEQKNQFITLIHNKTNTSLQNFLFYAGSLLIISALSWLLGDSWINIGHKAVLLIGSVYFVFFTAAGFVILKNTKIELLGKLFFCISIAVVPLIVYSLMKVLNYWPNEYYEDFYIWVRGKWIVLETATILVALLFLIKVRFHFIVFLISFCLWFMSMDIVTIIYSANSITWTQRAHISEIFGLCMTAAGWLLQKKNYKDYSFWLYLFGLLAITSGASVFYNDNAASLALLLAVHILMCFTSIYLSEPVFMVFGVAGCGEFLSRIAWIYFSQSILFPFALTIIGILIVSAGVLYQKYRALKSK